MSTDQPFVTFITVVYNGVSELEPTIQSILRQSGNRFEYFIIDGGSTDGTIELIKKYESQLSGWISEPDRGLYDAMNKGMKLGKGKYLWFMNAGDLVYADDTLAKIVNLINGNPITGQEINKEIQETKNKEPGTQSDKAKNAVNASTPDVIYGETEIIDEAGRSLGERRLKAPAKLNWKSLQWGMVVCHQSFLVKRENCLTYDSGYRFAADVDWMIRVLRNSQFILPSGMILSKFKSGGLTYKNIRHGLKERFRIMVKNYGPVKTLFNHVVLGVNLTFYYLRHRRI